MRTKVTLILILLNVALFFFIFKFERAWRTEDALREARRRVLGAETADIRTLQVTSTTPGGPSYTLVRNRDTWMLTQPLDWPANQHAVHPILQALQFLENETSFSVADLAKNGQSLADYGLERPRLTVTFTSGEGIATTGGAAPAVPTTVLRIGDATNVGNRLYVLSPDGTRIHVVNRSLVDALSVPLDQLRADTLFTIRVFEARALTVQTSGARVRIAARENGRWMFDTIVNARASKTKMDLTINDLDSLRATSFPGTPPAVLPSASPALRVTLDGNNRAETLLLGEPVKAGATTTGETASAKAATEFYAQLMNGNTIRTPVFTVTVANDLLARLRDAQTELRERRILEASAIPGVPDFDPAAVTAVTLAAPNQPTLTLQRLDASASNSPWQLVRPNADAAGPQTITADATAVRHLLDRLALLSAVTFASDAPSNAQLESWGFNRPEREITLTLAPVPGAANRTLLLQLGTDTSGAVYARVGAPHEPGASVYGVAVNLAQDFPVDTRAWRDRRIRELPATARVAALKLVDLSTRKVIAQADFNADGKVTADPHDATAFERLAAAMRDLRATRFVSDHFTDHMLVGGDERTWRYELDATVTLPGGAAEQTNTTALFFTERVGGSQQLAGSKEFDVVFEPEQPVIDALWSLTYGSRDPGPQPEQK